MLKCSLIEMYTPFLVHIYGDLCWIRTNVTPTSFLLQKVFRNLKADLKRSAYNS